LIRDSKAVFDVSAYAFTGTIPTFKHLVHQVSTRTYRFRAALVSSFHANVKSLKLLYVASLRDNIT